MSTPRYSAKFKEEAIKQVTERGHPVTQVAARLSVEFTMTQNFEHPLYSRRSDFG